MVEDDPDTRRMLVAAIADGGYDPIPALDGQHALRTALVVQPSAIVLDLMLPGIDGQEFVREYREHAPAWRNAPIMVVSARHDAEQVGKDIGASAVLPKPVNIDELIARLSAMMAAPA